MDSRKLAAPTPEVQYLPAIFRRVDNGEIRIPAFQRRFVWTEAQILELLESVYKGYPIGSVLFWRVDEQQLLIENDPSIPFPDVEVKYPISFVLDGMQRLSSLYGVFHGKPSTKNSVFNVIFDLRKEMFQIYNTKDLPNDYIHLSALFSPRQFLEAQKNLSERVDGDLLIDRAIKLHSIFQEYLIPTVTITRRDVSEVVEIFERINSTGTRLNAVDFMRALTWSADFDLSKEVNKLQDVFESEGYSFEAETLVKTIAIMLDKNPTPNNMLELKKVSPIELHDAVHDTEMVLHRVVNFLKNKFNILSAEYVPYEGQLLVLAKLFSIIPEPDPQTLNIARSWFWSISLSEGLRGKPADAVTRSINEVRRLAARDFTALDYRLNLGFEDFIERRFIRGKALSAAFASMLAIRGARSLVSGQVIDPETYMIEFSSENFVGLYPLNIVHSIVNDTLSSARTFANVIVISEVERKVVLGAAPKILITSLQDRFGGEAKDILATQFISEVAVNCLLNNDVRGFFIERAKVIYEHARLLTSRTM